ncbi:MAG: bifunctional oligoribonuclease/PAP phosphatase NrnA [Clostridiales bacterium]|jgi:phosphoesterase RecJ-like protein|nr:bifunctional oligoribonuclease/PAP phosphatase NrnA [Clostridiales bacterium]
MRMESNLQKAAEFLKQADKIEILSHQYPDGDTIGSAAALCRALRKMGKQAQIYCNDPFPGKFQYMMEGLTPQSFESQAVVAVDIADTQLLGPRMMQYATRVDWCIDHHGSNTHYAQNWVVDPTAAATTEIIARLIVEMGVEIDREIAACIYTGITTDTGCFRYTNATPATYRIAADMMEKGVDAAYINRVMFDTKSRARLELERRVLDTMAFYFQGQCAVIYVTKRMMKESGASDDDMDGLASLPRQVEGVKVGITMREKEDGSFKISLRSNNGINASEICSKFGGGGHPAAAGCVLHGSVEEARQSIVQAVSLVLGEIQ